MSQRDLASVERALEYALRVIQSYEMDIRNSEWTGVNLIERGFCQGTIYQRALDTIASIANGEHLT